MSGHVIRFAQEIKTDDENDELMMLLCCLSPGVDPWPPASLEFSSQSKVPPQPQGSDPSGTEFKQSS